MIKFKVTKKVYLLMLRLLREDFPLLFANSLATQIFLFFSQPEPYQKVCRISSDCKLLASGGDDGILRVWTFPDLNAVHEIEAHTKEIDDLEFR